VVNGQYVFLADYERRVDQYELALLDQGLDPDTQEGHAQLDQVGPDVLESMIGFVLIEQSAAALGATVSDEELEEKIEADIATGGGQAAFDEWLQATGQTREDYRAILREYMLSQGVLEAVTADVSDTAEQVRARHIVVASEGEAEEIAALLADGADFEMLAQQRSLDVATRDDGGDQGWFPRGLVATEMESAAFSLQPGELSDPFWLGEGYHILQVVEREDARALSPEMLVDLTMSVFERWLDEQRSAAVIERFVGE
jgi:parvulin-like peptidyl-prolyl isomerase